MNFKRMFKENYDIMKDALDTDNVADAKSLIGKSVRQGHLLVYFRMDFKKMSPEMARLLVRDMSDADWQKWNFEAGERDKICSLLFIRALINDRADMLDIFKGAGIAMNEGKVEDHPFSALCLSGIPAESKAAVLDEIMAQGIDKVSGRNEFLKNAAAGGFIYGFDTLKPLLDVDIHSDNEHMLRHAAEKGKPEMCLHLVRKYGADIDVALITERTLGHQKAADVLESVRAILKPEAKPAPTIAGLATQVQTLEQTVAELQANIRDITVRLEMWVPEKGLDKALSAPATMKR